jgi:hypothetical protein
MSCRRSLLALFIVGVSISVIGHVSVVRAASVRDVVISEVAWMGTQASANDEWIELYNNTSQDISLAWWRLEAADGTPSIVLSGTIPAHGFFLLERTDDNTVSDIVADQIYTGALSNSGESLILKDPAGNVIDTANGDGGPWPAGNDSDRTTMERVDLLAPDSDANWATNNGVSRNGLDAQGNPINGTPKAHKASVCHHHEPYNSCAGVRPRGRKLSRELHQRRSGHFRDQSQRDTLRRRSC